MLPDATVVAVALALVILTTGVPVTVSVPGVACVKAVPDPVHVILPVPYASVRIVAPVAAKVVAVSV